MRGRPLTLEGDLVERLARRLHTDFGEHGAEAAICQRQRVRERFGNRLDRELGVDVTSTVDLAVKGGEDRAEAIGIGRSELGDVSRRLPRGVRLDICECLGQVVRND